MWKYLYFIILSVSLNVRCGRFGCLVIIVLLLWVGRGLSGWMGVLLGVCLCWDDLW